MPRRGEPLKIYHNQQVMDDLNYFMIAVKAHLYNVPDSVKNNYPKPTIAEMDALQLRINGVLAMDNELIKKV